jgi:hypothetical protein
MSEQRVIAIGSAVARGENGEPSRDISDRDGREIRGLEQTRVSAAEQTWSKRSRFYALHGTVLTFGMG